MDLRKTLVPDEDRLDELERMIDRAIALSGGDMRQAIRGLILGQQAIEARRMVEVSLGYVRGKLH